MKQRFYTLLPYALATAPVFVLDHLLRHFGMWGEYVGVADFGRSFFSTVLYFLCIPLIRSVPAIQDRRLFLLSCISGLLMSLTTVWSVLLIYENNLVDGFDIPTVLFHLLLILGLAILTVPLCAKILNALDSFLPMLLTKAEEKPCGQRMFFFYRQPFFYFLTVCFLMLLCWLPHFFTVWPGYINYDARWQLQAYVEGWYNAHHPVLHSFLLG
ncbi:MAG: hypothetical protein IJP92_01505, partial [Lachnospiraceae bacterium]|nr:hypothetical protein [Lachnospiraceae bacterium]